MVLVRARVRPHGHLLRVSVRVRVRDRVRVSRPHGQGSSRVHCAAWSLESPPQAARVVRCGSTKTALTSRHVSAHMATCAFRAPPFAPKVRVRARSILHED